MILIFSSVSEIFVATSAIRPRADVAYCIRALSRRLAKTRNWTVIYFDFTACGFRLLYRLV